MSAPIIRLSATYLVYFTIVGVVAPYLPVYLKSLGFGYEEVGVLTSIVLGTKVFAPVFWGHLADRSGRFVYWVRLGALAALAVGLLFPFVRYPLTVGLVLFGFSFFWNAVLPQLEVITLTALGSQRHHYSRIRLWGSLGFIGAVTGIGQLLDLTSPMAIPWSVVTLLAMLAALAWSLPECTGLRAPVTVSRFRQLALSPTVWPFWVMVFLLQWSFGAYYVFFTLTLERAGYSFAQNGMLWSLGVVAEIVLFTLMPKLLARFTLSQLFGVSLAITVVRWLVIAWFTDYPILITLAQLGHAFSFGVMHACSIEFLHRTFAGKGEGMAQSAYSAVSFGLGGAVGATTSGVLYESGGPVLTYSTAALIAALAMFALWTPLRHRLN